MSLYSIGSRQNQEIAAYISVGVAIVTFLIVIFYHLKSTLLETDLIHKFIKQRRRIHKLDSNIRDTEMKAKPDVTTSEVTMPPQHVETKHTNLTGMINNLQEPLLN